MTADPHTQACVDLWIAVINQALSDATLGISARMTEQKNNYNRKIRHVIPANHAANGTLLKVEVHQARNFIKGQTPALRDICSAIGLDYKVTREKLLEAYTRAQPYLPPEWQDKEFTAAPDRAVVKDSREAATSF